MDELRDTLLDGSVRLFLDRLTESGRSSLRKGSTFHSGSDIKRSEEKVVLLLPAFVPW